MTQPLTFAQRFDPYKNYRLRILDGQQAYFGNMVTGLLGADVANYRAGGDPILGPIKLPRRGKYDSVSVTRGITPDPSFANWASQVWDYGSSLGSEVSLANFRKTISLEFYNEAGQLMVTYRISHGWVYENQLRPAFRCLLHNLHQGVGPTPQEKLAAIFQDSLDRIHHATG